MTENINGKDLIMQRVSAGDCYGQLHKDSSLIDSFSTAGIDAMFVSKRVIKQESSREVFIGTLAGGEQVFCKVYQENGLKAAIRRGLSSNRAELSHRNSVAFQKTDTETPDSLGYIMKKRGAMDCVSYHFCRYVNNGETLSVIFLSPDTNHAKRSQLLLALAKALAKLHGSGYVHGDTKLKNILFDGQRMIFVDLDSFQRQSRHRSPARDVARVLVGLAEVGLTASGFSRFVNCYCDNSNKTRQSLQAEIRRMVAVFQLRHERKYGRRPVPININED